MKKLILLFCLFALAASAQIYDPPNGATLYTGTTVNFCYRLNGYNHTTVYLSNQNQSGDNLGDYPGYSDGCVSFPITQAGTLYIEWVGWRTSGPADLYYTTYTMTGPPAPAVMASPTPGAILAAGPVTFSWAQRPNANAYWLNVGTSPEQCGSNGCSGGTDIFNSQQLSPSVNSVTANIPATGGTLYVGLWTLYGSSWYVSQYTYTAAQPVDGSLTPIPAGQPPNSSPDDYDPTQIGDIAVGTSASQSSIAWSGDPQRAVDGNTDGNWPDSSVSHTNNDGFPFPWWQTDLGAPATIQSINIWNRTDCCNYRLSDYWVFISNSPFQPGDDAITLANRPGTWSSHQTSMPNPNVSIYVGGAIGQYVRVQLSGQNGDGYLSLAEVQVMGNFQNSGTSQQLSLNPPAIVSRYKTVKVAGQIVRIPRGDMVNIGDLQYYFSGSGPYTYRYTFDNSDLTYVNIGQEWDEAQATQGEAPKGWAALADVATWFIRAKDREKSKAAAYSFTSPLLPGLMPMYFQGDAYGIAAAIDSGDSIGVGVGTPFPHNATSRDTEAITDAANLYNNSLKRYVIGPVFPADVSQKGVMARVKQWATEYGFAFLQPLLNGGSLNDLSPSNQLERDIVDCLARVLK